MAILSLGKVIWGGDLCNERGIEGKGDREGENEREGME